jgi:energy-coupling factor transporter ATP-binding protein EcfA2
LKTRSNLIIPNFRSSADDDVGGLADVGRGKLTLVSDNRSFMPLARMACRDAWSSPLGEQHLLNQVLAAVEASSYPLSRALIVNYYVSLKTNPFVILTGPEGQGKTELARLFAEALVGAGGTQYTLISSAGIWPDATGQEHYYRSLQEQFCSWRFLDLLQEAAEPSNAGKAYMVCFDALHPDEIEYYFATLLQVTPTGEKRLNFPGFPLDRQPIVPPNVYITATVNTAGPKDNLSKDVLRNAGLIEFRQVQPRDAPVRLDTQLPPALPPPVGYQRLWMSAALHDLALARTRLAAILGEDAIGRLRCSPELSRLLWRGGLALTSQTLQDLTTYIANSFDESGRGLFAPYDSQLNAQIAFDAQVVQRVLWRLRESTDSDLRRDLALFLDTIAITSTQQAVA